MVQPPEIPKSTSKYAFINSLFLGDFTDPWRGLSFWFFFFYYLQLEKAD